MKKAGKVFCRWGEPGAITTENKKAGETPAVQKKSPDRVGAQFSTNEVYQPIILLSRPKSVWTRACHGPRFTKSPAKFSTVDLTHPNQASTKCISALSIKIPLAFQFTQIYLSSPRITGRPAIAFADIRSFLRREDKGPWS